MCSQKSYEVKGGSKGGCNVRAGRLAPQRCDAGVCPACATQAQKYAALRKPYLINDMAMQDVLLDRRRVYQKLQVCSGASIVRKSVVWEQGE